MSKSAITGCIIGTAVGDALGLPYEGVSRKRLPRLGLRTAASETLTNTLRRRKNRSDDLLQALRYERALVYEQLGWGKRYRKALERLYPESPDPHNF